jgi:hypothetical protein
MDMATHEDTLPAPIGPEAEAEAARIVEDRKLLAAEEGNERELIELRKSRLADADDAEIDDIELKIGASRSKQLRLIERIEVRSQRLINANAKVRQSLIDDLIARGEAARELGEKILKTDYAKAAKSLGLTLSKLHAISTFIETANRFLQRRGIKRPIASPNAIRCRPRVITEVQVMRTVDYLDPRHPAHGNVYFAHDGRPYVNGMTERAMPVEIEVTERRDTDPYFPSPVEEEAFIPGLEPHAHFWSAADRISEKKRLAALADLGINPELPELE